MPKAYWIAQVDIHDDEGYGAYRAANAAAFEKYRAKFLVRGAPLDIREGTSRARAVVIEFESLELARACYESEEYRAALALRAPVSTADLVIVEGWDG